MIKLLKRANRVRLSHFRHRERSVAIQKNPGFPPSGINEPRLEYETRNDGVVKAKLRDSYSGQMLIEIVIAIGIIGLVLVGVSDLMTRSIRVVSFQKQKDEALVIIKKMLIDYKATRDTDPEGFYAAIDNATIDPCIANSVYKCVVTVDKPPTLDSVTISILAEWQDGGKTYSVTLSQSLTRSQK